MSKWFTGFLSFADELKMNSNTRNNQWALDTEIEAGKVSIWREESISHQISPETSPAKPASCKAVFRLPVEAECRWLTVQQPTRSSRHTQPRFQDHTHVHDRERQFQSGSKKCSPSHRNPCLPPFGNACSRSTRPVRDRAERRTGRIGLLGIAAKRR